MAIDYFKIGQISGKQFTDVTGAVEKGLEAGFKPLVEWQKKKDKFDADYARLLQSTPNIDNLPELPTNYLPKASEWLISKQQEYAENARATLKTRPGSPEYQQAVMNMNNIKSAVANLKANLTGINTERKEFLKAYDTGEISQGFQNPDIYEAYSANGAITAIDANGNVALSGAEGKSFNWNERQEYFTKSGKVQADLFLAGDNALKEGEAGKQRDLTYFTEKSKAIVAQYDLPRIKSLVFDDLDGTDTKLAEDAELVSLINSSKPNLPEIREALAGKLGQAMFDVNKTGFKTYSDKQAQALAAQRSKAGAGKPSEEQEARERATRAYNLIAQDPIAYAKTKLRGAFKGSQGKSKITLQIGEEDKTYDLTKPSQFQEFMDVARENSELFTTGSEGAELTRAIFYDIVREQSKKISEIQAGREKEQQAIIAKAVSTAIPGVNPINTADLPIF